MIKIFRHPRASTIFLAHTCAMALLMVFAMAIGLAWSHMPTIEGYVVPVVHSKIALAPPPLRYHDQACFSLDMHKVRFGEPIVYQFFVEARQNEHWLAPLILAAHIAKDDDTPGPDDYVMHQVGDVWNRRWCADLPATVADTQPIRISGYAIHRAHPFWTTETPLPSVVIDAVKP